MPLESYAAHIPKTFYLSLAISILSGGSTYKLTQALICQTNFRQGKFQKILFRNGKYGHYQLLLLKIVFQAYQRNRGKISYECIG